MLPGVSGLIRLEICPAILAHREAAEGESCTADKRMGSSGADRDDLLIRASA